MNDFSTEKNDRGQILLIVEGEKKEPQFFDILFRSFPQLSGNSGKVISYCTNIYILFNQIVTEYGQDCFANKEDIDLPFLVTRDDPKYPVPLRKTNFTDIFLVFDYERQDPYFSGQKIIELQNYFSDSADMGKLYINYPMFESYMDFSQFPDNTYEEKRVFISSKNIQAYKFAVHDSFVDRRVGFYERLKIILSHHIIGNEIMLFNALNEILSLNKDVGDVVLQNQIKEILTRSNASELNKLTYQIKREITRIGYCQKNVDYWMFLRNIFTEIIIANIKKANKVQYGYYDININDLRKCFERLDLGTILYKQNLSSANQSGFVWVLNTCVFLVADYNFSLIEDIFNLTTNQIEIE